MRAIQALHGGYFCQGSRNQGNGGCREIYLDYFGLQTGYMLSFNFNKDKKTGVQRVEIAGKVLFEGTV